MSSTYFKSTILVANTSYLSILATSIVISGYTKDPLLNFSLEDDSTKAWISSSKTDANTTLAKDWRDELLAQTEVQT